MNSASILENVFAWLMIGGGIAILTTVKWRPDKLWGNRKSRSRRAKP